MLEGLCALLPSPSYVGLTGLSLILLLMAAMGSPAAEVSFSASDGGMIYADIYGQGERGVVLAHGARFEKSSWSKQAAELVNAGFRVAAIDFRGYGKSRPGSQNDLSLDVLAAVRYLREHGASQVAVIGGSMGGGAAAEAVIHSKPGTIDRLVLLAPVPVLHPERISVPKLFAASAGDPVTPRVREQFDKAPEPKELLLLEGSAHAQFLFQTDQNDRLMREIVRFLNAPL